MITFHQYFNMTLNGRGRRLVNISTCLGPPHFSILSRKYGSIVIATLIPEIFITFLFSIMNASSLQYFLQAGIYHHDDEIGREKSTKIFSSRSRCSSILSEKVFTDSFRASAIYEWDSNQRKWNNHQQQSSRSLYWPVRTVPSLLECFVDSRVRKYIPSRRGTWSNRSCWGSRENFNLSTISAGASW